MDLTTAIDLVTEDTRASYPGMSREQAVKHARYTIDIAELNDPDATLLVVPTGEVGLRNAYFTVLNATPEELRSALKLAAYRDTNG